MNPKPQGLTPLVTCRRRGDPFGRINDKLQSLTPFDRFFQIKLGTGWPRNVFNVPGMPVAAAVTYAGMVAGLPTTYVSLPRNRGAESVMNQSLNFP